jgi:hypothetical protein
MLSFGKRAAPWAFAISSAEWTSAFADATLADELKLLCSASRRVSFLTVDAFGGDDFEAGGCAWVSDPAEKRINPKMQSEMTLIGLFMASTPEVWYRPEAQRRLRTKYFF